MVTNYLKIAWRSFVKNKVYAGINLMGLSIGIAGAIIVFQLVTYHLEIDRYHHLFDRTYRVVVDLHLDDGSVEKEKGSAFILHQTLKKEFSSVENTTYLAHKEVTLAVDQSQKMERFLEKEAAGFTNSDWFEIFDYEWISGKPSALDAPNQVVLTEKYARKYFGSQNPVGRYLTIDNQENLLVAGLLKDLPEKTDQRTEVFISLPTIKTLVPNYGYEDWGWIDGNRETYITLRSAQDQAAFEKQMPAFAKKYYGEIGNVFWYHLQPLSEVHFDIDYGGKIKYSTIVMLASVGLLLIFIACFNFINLTTAQSLKRSKEVGVRKILGVSQRQIFWFFMQETALYTLCACVLALMIAYPTTSLLREWMNISIPDVKVFSSTFLLFFGLLFVLVTLLAGLYPASVISNFNPLRAIKGVSLPTGRNWFSVRKGLVIAQFSISFVLIAVSMVIILQLRYIREKDMGTQKDLILHVRLPSTENRQLAALEHEFRQLPEVETVSFFRTPPSAQIGSGGSIKFENRDWEKFVARSKIADHNYIKTYGLKLVAGRNIAPSDTLKELLVNAKLVKDLGLKSPQEALNRKLLVGDIGKTGTIVGVLSDFNNADLYSGIEPTVVFSTQRLYRHAALRLNRLQASTLQNVSKIWQSQFPENVFEHSFYDEEIARFYQREELTSRLTITFAFLSIFLSCLGLFGLALFSTEQRIREIGIRKVLGASVVSITTLLSKDLLQLVVIASVVASPVAYYFMQQWLADFAFKVDVSAWIFLLAGAFSAGIAFVTIGFQSVKAALMNPVKSLRSE